MGNAWRSGQFAKSFTKEPRPRYIWNIFLLSVLGIILCFVSILGYWLLESSVCDQTRQIYLGCQNEYVITDVDTFQIADKEDQVVNVNALIRNVNIGESIDLTISSVSGRLLEVSDNGQLVYQVQTIQIGAVIAMFILVLPIIIFLVLCLIATNAKHPKGWMKKFQNTYVLIKNKKK